MLKVNKNGLVTVELQLISCVKYRTQTESDLRKKKEKAWRREQNQQLFPSLNMQYISSEKICLFLDIQVLLVCFIKTMAKFPLFQFCAVHFLTVPIDQKEHPNQKTFVSL